MTKKYKVKGMTLLHNKKTYPEGSTIELNEADAKRLEDYLTLIPNQSTTNKNQGNKTNSTKDSQNKNKSESKANANSKEKAKTESDSDDKDESGEKTQNQDTDETQDGGVDE